MKMIKKITLCMYFLIFLLGAILFTSIMAFSQDSEDTKRTEKLEGAIILMPSPQEEPYINLEIFVLRQKVKSNPLDAQLHYELGYKYTEEKNYDKSIAELEKAIELNPLFVKAMAVLGAIYFNIGRYKDAERILLEALKIDVNNSIILNNLGLLYYYSPLIPEDRYAKATPYMIRSVELSPDNIITQYNLAKILDKECFAGNNEVCLDSKKTWEKVIDISKLKKDEHHEKEAKEYLKKLEIFIKNTTK